MRKLSALVSTLIESLGAPIAIAAWFAVSSAAATEIVNQDATSIISGPISNSSSSTPFSASSSSFALQLPQANYSLSLTKNITANIQYHIPDTPIDLIFTFFGRPILHSTVAETVGLAFEEISTELARHPTESITDGFFLQRHDGLEIRIYQYIGQQVTWYLLGQLLHGIQCYAARTRRIHELRFEIDAEGKGRVGHGVLWQTGFVRGGSSDVAKRAAAAAILNETSSSPPPQQLSMLSTLLTNSTAHSSSHSSSSSSSAAIIDSPLIIPPNPNPNPNPTLILSYHFFGPPILETALSRIFALARQSIHSHVQLHPHDPIPNGCFEFRADDGSSSSSNRPMSIRVEAYAANEISWRLLDHVLEDVEDDMVGGRHWWACEFEFEIEPFREAYGHGFVEFDRGGGEGF